MSMARLHVKLTINDDEFEFDRSFPSTLSTKPLDIAVWSVTELVTIAETITRMYPSDASPDVPSAP